MKALVDYLGLTFRAPHGDEAAYRFLECFVRAHLGPEVELEEPGRGWAGYKQSAKFTGGLIAWGGNGETCHIELTGAGCGLVADWEELRSDAEGCCAKLTRCDVAYDDLEGQTLSIAWGVEQYRSGEGFKPERGTHPNGQLVDDLGSGKGCTLYVGSRDSGKLFRLYEKGRQLGDKESAWVRAEVEFRAVHRELPLQMLTNPGAYLAGAYPCLSALSVEQSRPRTVAFTAAALLEKAVDHAKKQAGRCLHAVLTLNGGDIAAALARIYRPELPERLKAAVLALVSEDEQERSNGVYMKRAFLKDASRAELLALDRAAALDFTIWRTRRAIAGGVPVGFTSL